MNRLLISSLYFHYLSFWKIIPEFSSSVTRSHRAAKLIKNAFTFFNVEKLTVMGERIKSKENWNCGEPFCDDKTQILPNVFAVVDVINLALNDYHSGAFLQKRRETSSCHFNLHNIRCGMTSYDGHSYLPLTLQSFSLFLPLFCSRSAPSSTNWLGVQFRVPSCRPSWKALREEFRSSWGTRHDS